MSVSAGPLRILQITDTHIIPQPGRKVYGVDSFAALERVLAAVRRDSWQPELVAASGDLTDDGTAASYLRLRSLLEPLGLPVRCIAGNHDLAPAMRANLCGGWIMAERLVARDPWQIVFVDSQVPAEPQGYVGAGELAALEAALDAAPERYTLVCLHHGPAGVCPMPICRLENSAELLAVLGRYPGVRGVIAGHNHCAREELHGGFLVMATPSTCLHIEHPAGPGPIGERRFLQVHRFQPGRAAFRRLELYPDGRIATEVVWVNGEP